MARIRTIKPEFWSDENLSECSLSARLLFIGLWNFVDDEGRMEFNAARIRMQVFPCGSVSLKVLTELLGELRERSRIRIYVIDGKEYLDVPNFGKHQSINRPTPSKLPEYSVSEQGVLTADSRSEGKGREGKGRDAVLHAGANGNGSARKRPLKAPLPLDFALTPALSEYVTTNLPDADQAALLTQYCEKAKAAGWVYADWDSAFRTYIRNARAGSGHWASGQYPRKARDPSTPVDLATVKWQ